MGCLIFDISVENRSLPAFSLCVIIGDSPFIALPRVCMVTPCSCCLFVQKEKSEYILSAKIFLLARLSAASLLRTVRSFSSADDKMIISGNGIVPTLPFSCNFSSHYPCFAFSCTSNDGHRVNKRCH